MQYARTLLIAVAVVATLFAGCIGDSGEDAPVPQATEAPPAQVTDTEGALKGEVVSDTLDRLAGAAVALIQEGEIVADTQADTNGKFTLNGLAPGEYVVQASALLHKNTVKAVKIEAGKIAEVSLMLEPLPTTGPYQEEDMYVGLLSLGADVADQRAPVQNPVNGNNITVGPSITWGILDENHNVDFPFNVAPAELETIIIELHWDDATVGMRADLWKNPRCDPQCDPEYDYGDASGFGELRLRVDRPADGWEGLTNETEELNIVVWPQASDAQPATVAYQQPYKVYWKAWYREAAPADAVVKEDG